MIVILSTLTDTSQRPNTDENIIRFFPPGCQRVHCENCYFSTVGTVRMATVTITSTIVRFAWLRAGDLRDQWSR